MRRLVNFVFGFLYKIWSLSKRDSYLMYVDSLYSKWLSHGVSNVGRQFLAQKPITIKGGKYISIGTHTTISRYSVLTAWDSRKSQSFNPNITIGDNCNFGEYNHITCVNSITIGNGVLTGRWVTITDNSHGSFSQDELAISPIERNVISKGPVVIEDNVWIGDKATILPNVRIGTGVIIAANAVVTKSVPAYTIVAGNPARVVKK